MGRVMNIRKCGLWVSTTALAAMIPFATASAADMPVKAAPIAAVGYDWSGVYVGVHAGYGGGMKDWDARSTDFVARGGLAGGQIGINKQLGSFVFGLELDGSWADLTGRQFISIGGQSLGVVSSLNSRSQIDGLATIAGRAGLAADRWFVFAKGGMTMAHERHSLDLSVGTFGGVAFGAGAASLRGDDIRYVPMVGFGAEYALGDNWSVKAEYDYIHMSTATPTLRGTTTTAAAGTIPFRADVRIDEAIHLAKIGVNYKFGGVAKDPSYAPVPAAPGTNWSGLYIGAQAGYGFGRKQWPDLGQAITDVPPLPQYDMKGWLGGGTVGVNAQAGRFVFGVEGEFLGTDIKGSQAIALAFPGATQTLNYDSKIDWLALATARAGFVVGDRLMLYGKGGLAIAQEHNFSFTTLAVPPPGSVSADVSAKAVHTGVVVGAGGEYALGNNWSVKAEYDYIKMFAQEFTTLGTVNFNIPNALVGTGAAAIQGSKMNQDLQLVKVGVNYHFSPAPMVVTARY